LSVDGAFLRSSGRAFSGFFGHPLLQQMAEVKEAMPPDKSRQNDGEVFDLPNFSSPGR